jgi:hypothetical protein
MQPKLVKIEIPKKTLATRKAVGDWLKILGKEGLLGSQRCTSDALRVALTYTLRDWQRWTTEEGSVCKAMASSPTKQQGVITDIDIQERTPEGAKYRTRICRLSCQEDGIPKREYGEVPERFRPLYDQLGPEQLVWLGETHLFDQDLRDLCEALIGDAADNIWPGVWLCLDEAPGLNHIAHLGLLVTKGQVTVKTLTLEFSEANRLLLAEELAAEYAKTLEHLTKRLGYPKPTIEAIEADYLTLCERIMKAQETLGVEIPILEQQCMFEELLATTEA